MRLRPLSSISPVGWPAWLATVVGFALVCGVLAYWGVQLLAPTSPVAPSAAAQAPSALPDLGRAARLFGAGADAAAAGPARASNIVVVGVLAAGARGSAILAVDGKPAKAYGVGDRIVDAQRVLLVRPDAVVIGGQGVRSELPAPPRPDPALLAGAGRTPAGAMPSSQGAPGLPPGTSAPGTAVILPPGAPGTGAAWPAGAPLPGQPAPVAAPSPMAGTGVPPPMPAVPGPQAQPVGAVPDGGEVRLPGAAPAR